MAATKKVSVKGSDENKWLITKLQQIRFIPFDIGTEIDDRLMEKMHAFMLKNNYCKCVLKGHSALLSDGVKGGIFAYQVTKGHQLYIFKKGVCVSVINDDYHPTADDFFSIKSCQDRWSAHNGILGKKEKQPIDKKSCEDGECIGKLAGALREIVANHQKELSEHTGWKGTTDATGESFHREREEETEEKKKSKLSYVMTMHVICLATDNGDRDLEWKNIPKEMRRNIKVLLDPAIIDMEDSSDTIDHDLKKIESRISRMNAEDGPQDYEEREDIATYMSWSSVVVLGTPSDDDIKEYILLEALLQSNWHLVEQKEKELPRTIEEAKRQKRTSVGMRMDQFKFDRYIEETTYHSGSTLPTRFRDLQKGLMKSSRLTERIARERRMARYMSESMMYDDQLKQRKYGRTSEILLLLIALINASSILYGWLGEAHVGWVVAIITAIAFIGVVVLWRK